MRWTREIFIVIAISVLALTSSCGAAHQGSLIAPPLGPVSKFFGAQPVPASVDADLWRRLVAEFDRVLQAQGTARRTSAAPIGKGSEVADLWLYSDGGTGADTRWSYRNEGDLNLDGSTTVADLVPIGVHYQASSTGSNWLEDQIADADGNGLVSISDLTPIGHNFGGRLAGYELQSQVFGSSTWTPVAWTPFIASAAGSSKYPQYSLHIDNVQANFVYRVVPTANGTAPYVYGVPSNPVLYGLAGTHFWSQQSGGPAHTGRTPLNGPDSADLVWSIELAGTNSVRWSPVADAYGTCYLTTSGPSGPLGPGPGTLYAVDRFGQLQWSYRSGASMVMPPVLSVDETVLVQEGGGTVVALTRDGKLKWVQPLAQVTSSPYWGLVVADDGNILAPDGDRLLYELKPNGNMTWSRGLFDSAIAFPTIVDSEVMVPLLMGGIAVFTVADGTPSPALAESTSVPLLYFKNQYLVINSSSSNTLKGWPVGANPFFSYAPPSGLLNISAALLSTGGFVTSAMVETGPASKVSTLLGLTTHGVQDWSSPIPAGVMSPLVVDASDDIYFSALTDTGTMGIYSVNAAHNIAWFYPTGTRTPGGVCPIYPKLLVCPLSETSGAVSNTWLTAIGTPAQ